MIFKKYLIIQGWFATTSSVTRAKKVNIAILHKKWQIYFFMSTCNNHNNQISGKVIVERIPYKKGQNMAVMFCFNYTLSKACIPHFNQASEISPKLSPCINHCHVMITTSQKTECTILRLMVLLVAIGIARVVKQYSQPSP